MNRMIDLPRAHVQPPRWGSPLTTGWHDATYTLPDAMFDVIVVVLSIATISITCRYKPEQRRRSRLPRTSIDRVILALNCSELLRIIIPAPLRLLSIEFLQDRFKYFPTWLGHTTNCDVIQTCVVWFQLLTAALVTCVVYEMFSTISNSSRVLFTSGANENKIYFSFVSGRLRVRLTVVGLYAACLVIASVPQFFPKSEINTEITAIRFIEFNRELPSSTEPLPSGCQLSPWWKPDGWNVYIGSTVLSFRNIFIGILICNMLVTSVLAFMTIYLWRKRQRLSSDIKTFNICARRYWLQLTNHRDVLLGKTSDEIILMQYLDELSMTTIVTSVVLVVIWLPASMSTLLMQTGLISHLTFLDWLHELTRASGLLYPVVYAVCLSSYRRIYGHIGRVAVRCLCGYTITRRNIGTDICVTSSQPEVRDEDDVDDSISSLSTIASSSPPETHRGISEEQRGEAWPDHHHHHHHHQDWCVEQETDQQHVRTAYSADDKTLSDLHSSVNPCDDVIDMYSYSDRHNLERIHWDKLSTARNENKSFELITNMTSCY